MKGRAAPFCLALGPHHGTRPISLFTLSSRGLCLPKKAVEKYGMPTTGRCGFAPEHQRQTVRPQTVRAAAGSQRRKPAGWSAPRPCHGGSRRE
jgi:hypothetical protein